MISERWEYGLMAFAVILMVSMFVCCASAEEPRMEWSKTFGGMSLDEGRLVQQTSDGGYIIAGWTASFGAGSTDVYLIKTNKEGNEEWSKTFGGSSLEFGYSVQQTSDGGYILTGETRSFGVGKSDVHLIKTDKEGNEEWSKTFGGQDFDWGYSVRQTSDGGYIIAGCTSSFGAGNYDVYLIKTNKEGNEEWSKTFGGTGPEYGFSVQQTSDDGYIISGYTQSSGAGGHDVYLIKTDEEGNEEWSKTFGGSDYDCGRSVQQPSDGGYIIAGNRGGFVAADVYLIKTDEEGNEEWSRIFGGSSLDYGFSVQQTSDDGYIIAGSTGSFGAGSRDVYLIKTNVEGNEEWSETFGGTGPEEGYSVQQTSDGGYIIAGSTGSFGVGVDVWLIKLAAVVVTSCDPNGNETNQFTPGENVYVTAEGLEPNANYSIWIQDDPVNEEDILNTSEDPSGLQENVTTNATGRFGPILIWSISANEPTTYREYDIVVDKQDNGINRGKYNSDSDGIDSATAVGFVAPVPELPTMMLFLVGLVGLAGYVLRRKNG